MIHGHGAGWPAHVADLARYLAGAESAWRDRWEQLRPTYQAMPIT